MQYAHYDGKGVDTTVIYYTKTTITDDKDHPN